MDETFTRERQCHRKEELFWRVPPPEGIRLLSTVCKKYTNT